VPLALTELQALEQRRQSIVAEARALASTGNTVAQFQSLLRRATLFVNEATRALPPRPFPAAEEAGTLLANCIRLLEKEREISPRRVTAVTNCHASSRLLADALSSPLTAALIAPPGLVPVAELPDFELLPTPTRRNVELLVRHLQLLQQLETDRGDVRGRVAELEQDLLDWEFQMQEAVGTESAREDPRPVWAVMDTSAGNREINSGGVRGSSVLPRAAGKGTSGLPGKTLPKRSMSRCIGSANAPPK
jgi:hypothetical protein